MLLLPGTPGADVTTPLSEKPCILVKTPATQNVIKAYSKQNLKMLCVSNILVIGGDPA